MNRYKFHGESKAFATWEKLNLDYQMSFVRLRKIQPVRKAVAWIILRFDESKSNINSVFPFIKKYTHVCVGGQWMVVSKPHWRFDGRTHNVFHKTIYCGSSIAIYIHIKLMKLLKTFSIKLIQQTCVICVYLNFFSNKFFIFGSFDAKSP